MKLILFLLLGINLIAAQENYSFRVAYGKATLSDFSEIIVGNWQGHPKDLRVLALDGGYLLKQNLYNKPIDAYIRGSLSHFNEDHMQKDVYEAAVYLKLFYNFLDKRFRFGFGEGVSYTTDVLYTEWLEATQEHDNNSKFLNYIDLSLDFNVGKLFKAKSADNIYVGWALKHRSGIFGLINNVRRGGSNYNTFYIETHF